MNLTETNRWRGALILLSAVLVFAGMALLPRRSNAETADEKARQAAASTPKDTPERNSVPASIPSIDKNQYIIGPEDTLQISVWHEPEVSGVIPVRPDGMISVLLIGDLKASGLTPVGLQEALTVKLRAFISNPEVTVTIQQVKSRNFNVLGEVQRPGSFPLNHSVRVLDAIGMAGGFRDFAKVTKIYVLRPGANGENVRLPFNYKQVVKGTKSEQNVELQPNDTVVIP